MNNYQKHILILNLISLSFIILLVGVSCNFLVITNNSCNMPFRYQTNEHIDGYISFQDESEVNYYYLSDIIPISHYLFSIGDLLMIFAVIFHIILQYFNLKLTYKDYKNEKV